MTRSIGLVAIMVLLSACGASAPPTQHIAEGHQPGEEAAVLEVLDRYVTAISETDLEAQAAMQTPDGMTYQWRPDERGGMQITARPNSYWIDPSRDDGHVYRERYWSPTVMIRGGIAVVWAPYEFWVDGETSHCGVDVFDFVKIDGKWLVSNAMWTVEPEACAELRPVEAPQQEKATRASSVGVPPYRVPEQISDGWRTASLDDQRIESGPIVEMLERIRAEEFTGISSVLLARGGDLVLEEYFGEFGRDDLHSTRSAAKAITSALVGIAIDQRFIESVDVPLLPYFPEYEGEIESWDERKRDITVAHLLTMTSGVLGNEDEMYPTDDWIEFYLDQPLAAAPGEAFSYATSGVVTLGNVITRASGLRIPAFADRYLFGPLGITEYRWPITNSRGSQGLAMTGGGLNLRPRDMLKFGQLYLNGGVWEGERIISESWIEESTRKHATSDLYGEDFGYLWRMIDRTVNGRRVRSFEAWGNGGQFIMVFPSLDLVAVFTGENYGLFPEMEQPFEMIDQYILPAMN